jgi:hypothetical protein
VAQHVQAAARWREAALKSTPSLAAVTKELTADLDLLPLLQPTSVPGTGIQVTATNLAIVNVVTLANSVDVTFDIKLSAR